MGEEASNRNSGCQTSCSGAGRGPVLGASLADYASNIVLSSLIQISELRTRYRLKLSLLSRNVSSACPFRAAILSHEIDTLGFYHLFCHIFCLI